MSMLHCLHITLSHTITFTGFVPLLQNIVERSLWPLLLAESLKALGGLGLLSLGGKYLMRRVFEVCYLLHSEICTHIFCSIKFWFSIQ